MESYLLLLAFPLIWVFVAKRIWNTTITWQESAIQVIVIVVIVSGVWFAGKYGATVDQEVWNGAVTSKDRDQGHYVESYSCHCHSDSKGHQHCSTCYRDHYTVTWTGRTTVGNVTFDHLDSTSSFVYASPDPSSYKRCTVGEPASIEHNFTNYVKAVPESLFNTLQAHNTSFAGKIPAYPQVFDFYRFNRVINIDSKMGAGVKPLANLLDNSLKLLGASKQVNIIVLLTEIRDPSYRQAVENVWLGAKKNDVVVFLGLNGDNIVWTDVMTWALNSGNELFHVKVRDDLKALGTFDPTKVAAVITDNVKAHYDRPHMKDYEYLADDVQPATWVIVLAIILAVFGSVGLTYFFNKNEVDLFNGMR